MLVYLRIYFISKSIVWDYKMNWKIRFACFWKKVTWLLFAKCIFFTARPLLKNNFSLVRHKKENLFAATRPSYVLPPHHTIQLFEFFYFIIKSDQPNSKVIWNGSITFLLILAKLKSILENKVKNQIDEVSAVTMIYNKPIVVIEEIKIYRRKWHDPSMSHLCDHGGRTGSRINATMAVVREVALMRPWRWKS